MLANAEPVGLVLAAALMHATWNAIVKAHDDRLLVLAAVKLPTMAIGAAILVWTGLPDVASLPFACGSALAFVGYAFLLVRSYALADFNFVYPVARGAAPLMVALASGVLLGEWFGPLQMAAFLLACAGFFMIAFAGAPDNARRAIGHGLGVSGFIAVYTILDGIGARASGNALAYTAFGNILSGLALCAIVCPGRTGEVRGYILRHLPSTLSGGVLMFFAYAAVLQAMTMAPVALVAALRETSVVFAAIIGALVLKERAGTWRLIASVTIAAGVGGMLLAGQVDYRLHR